MLDWHTFGVISIILNIIFVLLLFFRSALNDILKDWWIDRKKKKEATIRRLIDFKINFNTLQVQNFLVIITLAKMQVGLIMGQPVDQFIKDTYQSSLNKSSEAGSLITEPLDFLPVGLRSCYSRYQEQFTEIIKNIMQGHVGKEDVKEYSEKMKSLVLECTNLADSIIRKNLD
jgi:hypothetical protein